MPTGASCRSQLQPWRQRALEGAYPYLILDARYEKARVDHRHVLGVDVAMGETTATWSDFLGGLIARGLEGVRLVVADAHAGLAEARKEHFSGVPWQRCQRHFYTNALERAPKALEEELHQTLRAIWDESGTLGKAREKLAELVERLSDRLLQTKVDTTSA